MSRLDRVWGKAYIRSGAVRSGIDDGTGARKDFAADIADRIPEKTIDAIFSSSPKPPAEGGIGRAIWNSGRDWQPNVGVDDTE